MSFRKDQSSEIMKQNDKKGVRIRKVILSRWENIFSSAKWSQLEIIGGLFPHVIKYFM